MSEGFSRIPKSFREERVFDTTSTRGMPHQGGFTANKLSFYTCKVDGVIRSWDFHLESFYVSRKSFTIHALQPTFAGWGNLNGAIIVR